MASKPKTIGVRELRQNLSVYLARVKKGRVLNVTEHGQVTRDRPASALLDELRRDTI